MKKIFIAALICAMILPVSCDKLKESLSRDIPVNNVKFNFTALTTDGVTTRSSATTNSFSVTRKVDISELGSSEVAEYAGKISKVVVNNSLLKITTTPSGSYTVTDVTISAENVSGSLVIPSYSLGGDFTAPANMNSFTTAFIMKLLSAKSITVSVSGKTDAPAGTSIQISYENDLVFTAGLLE